MKHDHKKTRKLKVALFAMIMFLPFIAIGVTCATHIFNKDVAEQTQTAEIIYKYQTEQPQENAILKNDYIYEYNKTNHIQEQDNNLYVPAVFIYEQNTLIFEYKTDNLEYGLWLINEQEILQFKIDYYNEQNLLTEITIYEQDLYNQNATILIIYNEEFQQEQGGTNANDNNWFNVAPQNLIPIESVDIITNPQDQTTNIFYDSCDQVQDSFVLNWCTNENPIRNGINAFTNAFNLPNEHMINTLITYWICISMIYIVIDIIIECIIYITHFFNKEV